MDQARRLDAELLGHSSTRVTETLPALLRTHTQAAVAALSEYRR
jgi:hypothetical protein